MKKYYLVLAATLVLILGSISPVLAADVLKGACDSVNNNAKLCVDNIPQDKDSNSIYGPNGILTKVASILSIAIGATCVIVIIISGLRYILSGGDSQQTANAKNAILYAIIGIVITLTARGIVLFVLRRI